MTRSEEEPEAAASPAPSGTPSVTPREQYLGMLVGHGDIVLAVAFSPDGKTPASGASDRTVRIWDTATGRPISTSKEHRGKVLDMVFSPDGNLLASAADDASVLLWQAGPWKRVAKLNMEIDSVQAVAFSPDGALLAAGGTGGEVRLWSTVDWRAGTVLAKSDALIESLDFSRDGGWLIGGTESELGVLVWQIATGRLVREVEVNDEWPMIVRVSPDGASVATGTDHHLVRLRPMTDFTEG